MTIRHCTLFCFLLPLVVSRLAGAQATPAPSPNSSPVAAATTLEPPAGPLPVTPVYDEAAVRRRLGGPFFQGTVRFSLVVGTGVTKSDTYFILGTGLGYFVADGFELGVDYEAWLFGSPVLNRLSPEARYVFFMVPVIKPYVGFFYRHTFIKRHDDVDYLGGRAGLFIQPERSRAYAGAGAVYEHVIECRASQFVHCHEWYPEVSLGVTF
jgi:hypothetical protein